MIDPVENKKNNKNDSQLRFLFLYSPVAIYISILQVMQSPVIPHYDLVKALKSES